MKNWRGLVGQALFHLITATSVLFTSRQNALL
jgi:hypothetical protein